MQRFNFNLNFVCHTVTQGGEEGLRKSMIFHRLSILTIRCTRQMSSYSSSSTTKSMTLPSPFTVAIVCPPENDEVLSSLPSKDGVNYIIGNDIDSFTSHTNFNSIRALMFVAVGGDAQLLPTLFDACGNNVKWVHSLFAGVDALHSFSETHLRPNHITLTNGRGAFSESLAEYVMAAALHFNKSITKLQENQKQKNWDKFIMPTLKGKTMGFLGFGHIGTTTAKLAKQFGMKIISLRRDPSKDSPFADVVLGSNDKLKLFQESDFVVSVLPGTPETENYCSETEFSSMKDSGIFISVGRGSVVDEEALYNALNNNEIAGAALDVFKVEPLPEDSKLWDLNEKILLSSHNADFTQDYFELGWSVFEKNLNAFIESNGNCNDTTMITPVDKENGY